MTIILTARRRVCMLMLTLAVLLGILCSPIPTGARTPAASPEINPAYNPEDLLAIKPHLREEIAAILPEGLTVYDITIAFPEDSRTTTLTGFQQVTYTNTTGEALTAIPFRLYANSVADGNDAVSINRVLVDGQPADLELTVDDSVATVGLPAPLAPGEVVQIDMDFTTRLDQDDARHYGIFNHASETGTWSVAHWYPVVAGRDPESGWMLKPTSVYGDPIFSDTGLYTVHVSAPETMTLITSGVETSSDTSNGITATSFNAWPSRDFVIIADADIEAISTEVDGTMVRSWYEPGHEAAGAAALTWSSQALDLFNDLLGEYPYLQLQLAEVEIYNAAGVEFPQLVSIDRGYYGRDLDTSQPGYFEFTVAHEVVHQWFYNIVGNNQYDHAFIDESLTNYLSASAYMKAFWGDDEAASVIHRNLTRPFENSVQASNDPIVDFPTDAFPTQGSYITAAYNKGPLGFAAIHDAIGDDAFFSGLRQYVKDFRFRVATPADMLAAFEGATDVAVRPIWVHWFEERNGALDIRD